MLSPLKFKRKNLTLLVCPNCGEKHEVLYQTEGVDGVERFACYRCGYDFGEDDSKWPWVTQRVQTVVCPDCGDDVTCSPGNITQINKVQNLICPYCRNIIAAKLERRWRTIQEALFNKSKNGLLKADDRQDLFTISYFKSCANKEGEFWLSSKPKDGKILWVEGEAVGYYLANSQNLSDRGLSPCLRQIYVVSQHRNKGYGTIMLNDFLESLEQVVIEAPNYKLINLLKKMGFVDVDGRSTGRVSFITIM